MIYFLSLFTLNNFMTLLCRWENVESGQFRIADSVAVAQLWATVRGNRGMNYEKLSRAMRWEMEENPRARNIMLLLPLVAGTTTSARYSKLFLTSDWSTNLVQKPPVGNQELARQLTALVRRVQPGLDQT